MRRMWSTGAVLAAVGLGAALALAGFVTYRETVNRVARGDVGTGTAAMAADGVIRLKVRVYYVKTGFADAFRIVKPSDADYQAVRAHLPGIAPGKSMPIPMGGYNFGPYY